MCRTDLYKQTLGPQMIEKPVFSFTDGDFGKERDSML
jgi:hypothetical protein